MRLLFAFVLFASASVSAQTERLGDAGILVVQPAPALAYDAGLAGANALDPASASGPRTHAWRGAKVGFWTGLAVGVAATAATFVFVDDGRRSCEWFCAWNVAAVAAVPFTVLTTGTGAAIGSLVEAAPSPERIPAPERIPPPAQP